MSTPRSSKARDTRGAIRLPTDILQALKAAEAAPTA